MVNNNFKQHTVLGAGLWVATTHFAVIKNTFLISILNQIYRKMLYF